MIDPRPEPIGHEALTAAGQHLSFPSCETCGTERGPFIVCDQDGCRTMSCEPCAADYGATCVCCREEAAIKAAEARDRAADSTALMRVAVPTHAEILPGIFFPVGQSKKRRALPGRHLVRR